MKYRNKELKNIINYYKLLYLYEITIAIFIAIISCILFFTFF